MTDAEANAGNSSHCCTSGHVEVNAFGRLELEWCERKILLPVWWLEAGAGAGVMASTNGS